MPRTNLSSHPLLQEGAGGGPPKGGKPQQPHEQNLNPKQNKTDHTDAPSVPVRQPRMVQRVLIPREKRLCRIKRA